MSIQADKVYRMDKRLADMLHGEHDLSGLNREEKVVALANLLELYDATMKCGWHVHIGDWDWECTVVLASGEEYSTAEDVYRIMWPGDKTQKDATGCVDGKQVTFIEVYTSEDLKDEVEVVGTMVPVDAVAKVRFEELG